MLVEKFVMIFQVLNSFCGHKLTFDFFVLNQSL